MSFTTLFYGNQQEGRLGPFEMPFAGAVALVVPEPLRLTDIVLTNRTAGPLQLDVWIVPQGSTPLQTNKLLGTVNLPGNDLITYNNLNIPLNQQDQIWTQASGSGVNFFATLSRRSR